MAAAGIRVSAPVFQSYLLDSPDIYSIRVTYSMSAMHLNLHDYH
jgi:hypothetical protein